MQPKQHISSSQAASFIYFALNTITVSVYTPIFAITGRAAWMAGRLSLPISCFVVVTFFKMSLI